MTATRTQQLKTVGEGLALGAWMLGVTEVTGDTTRLQLDFRKAWREWAYAARFPAVKAGPDQDDVLHILRDSPSRGGVVLASWEGGWPFVPRIRMQDWEAHEVAEVLDESVPAEAWAGLVRQWLERPRVADGGNSGS